MILCDHDDAVLDLMPGASIVRRNDAGPHAYLQADFRPDAYLDIAECAVLVRRTLEFLSRGLLNLPQRLGELPRPDWVLARIREIEGVPCPVTWSPRAVVRHGAAMMDRTGYSIAFSKRVFEFVDVNSRVQTIIHEACHIAGFILGERGHGATWKHLMTLCGVPADVTSTAAAEMHPHITCSACQNRSTVRGKTLKFMQGGGTGMCRCGARITLDMITFPEGYKVPKLRASATRYYRCACGRESELSPKYLRLLAPNVAAGLNAKGEVRGTGCNKCGRALIRARVKPTLAEAQEAAGVPRENPLLTCRSCRREVPPAEARAKDNHGQCTCLRCSDANGLLRVR